MDGEYLLGQMAVDTLDNILMAEEKVMESSKGTHYIYIYIYIL